MDRSLVHIHLEVDRHSDPIRGQARDDRGRTYGFSSWLTLLAVVDDLRRGENAELPRERRFAREPAPASPKSWGGSP